MYIIVLFKTMGGKILYTLHAREDYRQLSLSLR